MVGNCDYIAKLQLQLSLATDHRGGQTIEETIPRGGQAIEALIKSLIPKYDFIVHFDSQSE